MALVRAKHARSSDYIYSKKRASLSIFVSTVLLVTTVSPASLALNANNSNVAIPALCDPTTLPITISPSPAVSTSTPQPEVSATPEIVPIPNPSEGVEPVAELISEDYVEPVIPAGESSATVSKSEPSTSPKVICPSPVTNVIARPQNTQLEISWIPGISSEPNTIENITDYYIKVLETSQVIKVPSDKTSTIISGLTNGTSYSIIVYAASEYGSSVASDLVAAIPLSGNEGEVAGIIVAFKPEANVEQGQLDVPGEELVSQVELTIENKITEDVHVVEFSEATTLEEAKTIANEISQDPQVVWAEPDQFVYTSAQEVINDPNYSTDQWNLWDKYGIGIGQSNTEMTTAWSLTAGQGINVAVIDTGITSHPDLDSQVIKGFDFVSDPEFLKATREENGPQVSFDGDYINSEKYGSLGWDDNPQDPGDWRGVGPVRNSTWHGTHIAGVIAAQSENQEGIAGIAPGAKIQPIRALSWRGGLLSDIASSITWASGGSVTGVADNPTPAKVINMSFSVNSICPTSLQTAINDAFARGSVLVAAAGNNNDDVKNYAPANCENVISVGASNKDGKRASYSNYGLGIDVSAPGGDANDNGIYSTANSGLTEPASFGYSSQQGTSISAAHVSAIAARILSANPTFNPTDVKNQITSKESVREFADTQCDINADIYCGEGIVSLFQIAAACSTSDSTYINGGITYNVRRFLDSGTCEWTTPSGLTRVNLLIVGGGGAGGGGIGGGGGAGEFVEITNSVVTGNTSYSITVGAGGTSPNNWTSGNAGASSSFASITAFGGGGGGTNSANGPTASGGPNFGSQGGGGYENTSYTGSTPAPLRGVATRSDGITGFRNNGGAGSGQGGSNATAGGGGGAGGGGSNAGLNNGGNGGSGKTSSITGSSTFYAAGGGGGVNGATQCPTFPNALTTGAVGSGGSSIGGNGGLKATSCGADGVYGNRGDGTNGTVNANGSPGATNTGSGGGGASNWTSGGVGGSGIVIVTYENAPTIASATISGTQKIGNTLTATAGSTTGTISSTSYQWQFSNDGSTSWTDISGATSSTYGISGTTYRDKYLRAAITVTNTSGTAAAFSSATSQIYYADCSPATTSPTISGVVRTVYSFTTTGTCDWSVPAGVSIANVLVVGGGGGAGGAHDNAASGGGGAGYVYANSTESISGKILITVGAGGTGGVGVTLGTFQNGNTGGDSIFGSVTALGGAGGLGGYESFSGGSCPTYTIPVKGGTAATLTQRATGGQDGCNNRNGFGGGGQNSTQIQTGGTGLASSITGSSITYGTGGTGAALRSNTSPAAQSSGTGNGGTGAAANTSTGRTGGSGGSGIVIVSVVTSSPTITAISPSTGSVTSGGSVTITGTNFVSGQTTATINGVSLTSVNVTSATSMTATLPNLTVGTHNLVVNNGTGSATSTGAFTVLAAPTIGSATISGTTTEGQTLTATANTVTGTSVTTTYQWQSATTSGGSYSNISGATSSTYVLTSSEATKFLKVIITVTNAGGSASATSSSTAVIQGNQSTLTVTSTSGTFGTALTLTTSGGSGDGSVTYVASTGTASSCTVSGTSLTAGSAGTCLVTATKASSTNYLSASSIQTTVTFAKASQSALSMTSASSVTYGNTLSLTSSGGTSTGSTTYAVSSGTCTISGSTLTPGDAGSTCIITGTKAADDNYNAVSTTTQTITINKATQSTLTINSSSSVAFGSTLTLSTTGGSGNGSVTYSKTGTCTISGSTLTPGDAGSSCVVTATKALDTNYNAISSATQTITITKINQSALTISSTSGTFGTSLTLTTSGGTTAGSVTYSVSDGTASTCAISSGSLSVASAGTCLVTATMAGNTNYNAVSSIQTTITFAQASQSSLTVSSTSGTFGTALTLTTSGGSGDGSVTYVASTGTASSCTVSGTSLTAGSAGTCLVTATKASSTNYLSASSIQTTVTFAKASQSALSMTSASSVTYGNTLSLTSTGGSSTGSTTYAVSSGTCTISGSTLTPGDAGSSCVITATKAADTNYNSVSTSTQTITVNKATQSTLTIDSASTVAFGSTLTLSTTGGSGTGSVTYSKTGTCTISSTTLTPGDAGSSCIVTATKALDTNYNAISSATQTITITKINQSALTINSTSGTFGSALILTTSGGTTAGSVTYSVSDGTASTCAISTGSLSVASAGTCLVTATMSGNTNYNAVVSTQTTITFAKASQSSLTVTSTSGTYGSALTLTTSGGSGDGAVTFVATPGTASSCTVSGSTLTAGSGGTCLVTATKATSTNYLAVSSSQTTVSFGNQAVSLSGFSDISSKNYGDTTFTLTAPTVAGSVAGTFTYSSGTTSVATISSSTVTIVGAGTSTITATFTPTETGRYSSQTITMLLTVNKKAITITAVDKTKVYAQSTPTNSFTNSTLVGSDAISSLTYTYSGTNSTSAPTTVGNYTITPSSASFSTGSINNYTITYVPAAYSITKATPAFTGFNNVSKTYGDSSFTITAPTVTGSISGSFAYSSSDTSAITISSATATVAGTGSSLITASFTPTDTTNYNSATTTMTISVAKATQSSLSITSASSVNYGSTISLTSSGGSGTGAISFAVTSGTCSISSTTLTPGNAGSTCVIQATKALDTNYNVATSSTRTITINKINQTVSFTSTAPSSPVSGDTYTPLASATSGAIPTISIASSSSSICSLSAGIVTFNTSGTCLIEADSASSTNYNAATTASQSITVAKIAQTITFNQPSASSFGDSSRSMSASASSGLAITYSLGASTTNTACSVSSSGVVTILAVGNCEVTAAQSGNSQYDSALSVSRTFAVNAIVPSAPFLTSVSAGNTNATVSFTAPSSNGGANLSAYEIVAMPTSGSNITKSNCSTSASPLACTITGLINGVSYTFKVAAVNSAGTGAYSTTSGSFTPATIANSVVNLVAQPGDGTLVVNWDQPTNLGGGSFTRYDVYYKSTGSYPGTPNAQINSVSTTTTTFSGLTNGTSYDVKVVAITSANASELAGNTAEVSQYPSTVASAPTNVAAAKLTATSARISWGLPLTDGGASLDATTPYVVTITGGPSAITCGTLSGRTCDISGLNPSSTYSISVKAQNRMGLGTAGTTTYLVPSNDANLLSLDLKTGATLSDPSNAIYSPSFDAATTSYSISVANTQAYARITPTVNEATATIKINGIAVVSGVARNLSLGIGSNVFTVEITAGDLATTKTYTLAVTRPKASQMPISITSANSVNYGSTITLSTSGGSGNGLMAFTTTGTCTTSFSGGNYVLTPGDVGSSCSIVATKATDDDYFAASSTSQTITINKTTPTLSDFTNISKTYGDPSFTINEPNVSGNAPGTFTYSSSNTSAITVSGSTITVAGNGSATITATFTPTSSTNYNSATTSLVITVAKKALRVTPANKTKFYGASHPTITNSVIGLAGSEDISTISYSYLGTGSTTYSASTTNPTDAGTYSMTPVITALTSGSLSNYEITYDSADFTISKVNQSALSITSSTSATFGSTLTLTTSGGSGTGAITFTKVSGDCTLNTSGSTYSITPGDAGNNCVVNASRAADTNYNLVSTSDQTITTGKANQSLSFTSSASSPKVNETYTPIVTSTHSSTGVATSITPSVTIDSASAAICSISSGIVTFNAAGSCVINADAVSSTNYNSATTASQTLTITVVTTTSTTSSSASSNTPTPTPSPSSGVRPNATRPIIRNVTERPVPEVRVPDITPNLPQLNNPALRPVFPSRNLPTIPNNFDTGLAITDNLGRLPLSEPGEKQIKVGNEFVPVIETVSPQGALTLTIPESVNVSPIEVSIQTTDIKGQNIPAPDDGIIRAVKGQTITVAGDGLTPGSTYSVWLFSEPTKLGEGKVSGDATFSKVFLVPDQLATGSHTLQINGINSDQKVVSLTTGVILTEVKEIQNVGDSNSDLIAYAILFIFFLLLIIAILLRYIRKQQLKYLV